jgi:hypothetical protein
LLCLRSHDPVDRPRVEPFLLERLLMRARLNVNLELSRRPQPASSGDQWLHEMEHDDIGVIARKEDKRVRWGNCLRTRPGRA